MVGYWEPHTSSIDFCEENYRFTGYVAELLNSVSSLPIALAGLLGLCISPEQFRSWPRFVLCWMFFVFVGLGSALFHATLRRPMQALDEVPMVVGNMVFVYCLAFPEGRQQLQLSLLLLLFAAALVVIYVVFEAYAVFLLMYGVVVLLLTIQSHRLCFDTKAATGNGALLRRLWLTFFCTYLAGVVVWVADNLACSQLGVGHLHILWHMLACTGTVYFVFALMALTAHRVGLRAELQRYGWIHRLVILDGRKAD